MNLKPKWKILIINWKLLLKEGNTLKNTMNTIFKSVGSLNTKLTTTEKLIVNYKMSYKKIPRTKHWKIREWKIEKRSYSKSRHCIRRKGLSKVTIVTPRLFSKTAETNKKNPTNSITTYL